MTVALVGAGPGDPDLLTLRAEELLSHAGTVVVDRGLTSLAARFAPAAHLAVVPPGGPAVDELLTAAARPGPPVVRLYRGDPWLHPAYADERAALERFGWPVEAVAGVAAEVAVPALAGLAVHVRHLAVACTVGPFEAMPQNPSPARTLVACGDDAAAMARSVAATGDGSMAAALVPVGDPGTAWRGSLAEAVRPAAKLKGPTLLVLGDVCRVPHPAVADRAPEAPPGPDRRGAG